MKYQDRRAALKSKKNGWEKARKGGEEEDYEDDDKVDEEKEDEEYNRLERRSKLHHDPHP